MRVLLAEDEPKTLAFICHGLEGNGFTVILASRGDAGHCVARTGVFGAIIRDDPFPQPPLHPFRGMGYVPGGNRR
jgi:DNA-binding response OmpR family regulator